jgi:hypothetical protein
MKQALETLWPVTVVLAFPFCMLWLLTSTAEGPSMSVDSAALEKLGDLGYEHPRLLIDYGPMLACGVRYQEQVGFEAVIIVSGVTREKVSGVVCCDARMECVVREKP